MPQLYENQIQAKASQNTYGKAPQIENYIGKALENVANLSDAVSKDLQRAEDARLKVSVDARTKEALAYMEETDPENFNYEEASARAAEIYNSAFEGFNGAAVRRFNRDNPEHSTMMDLSINKVALEKTREKTYYNIDESMPQWASNVALGKMSEAEYNSAIDDTNLTRNQKKTLKDKLNSSVNEFKIAAALSHGTLDGLDKAQKIIEDSSVYMTPERRAFWAAQINSKVADIKKERKAAKSEKDGMISDLLYETYLSSYYRDPAKAAAFKRDLEEIYVSGKPITFANGVSVSGDINSEDYINPVVLETVLGKIKNTTQINKALVQDTRDRVTANQVIEEHKLFKKEKIKTGLNENARKAEAVMRSRIFDTLDKDTQKKIATIANSRVLATQYAVGAVRLDLYKEDQEAYGQLPYGIGGWLTPWSRTIPSAPKQIINSIKSGNFESFAEGVAFARTELDKRVFNDGLELKANSNAHYLANAYVTLDAIRHDNSIMNKLGGAAVTSESLTKAFWGMLDEMMDNGTYNQDYDPKGAYSIDGPYGQGLLKTLLERASGVTISTTDVAKREFQRNLESYVLLTEQPWSRMSTPWLSSEEEIWTFRRGTDTGF